MSRGNAIAEAGQRQLVAVAMDAAAAAASAKKEVGKVAPPAVLLFTLIPF